MRKQLDAACKFLVGLPLAEVMRVVDYTDVSLERPARELETLFPLGFCLQALAQIPVDDMALSTGEFAEKLIRKLRSETESFSFNYFSRRFNNQNKSLNLPDDVDDTALLLSALQLFNQKIDPKFLLKIISLEKSPGGPYKTWYSGSDAEKIWTDIDPIVNMNILYFTALLGIRLPKALAYVHECLKSNQLDSPYYPYSLMFFLNAGKFIEVAKDFSSFSSSSEFQDFTTLVTNKLENYRWQKLTNTEKVLWGLAKSHLGVKLTTSQLAELELLQQKDGSCELLVICNDFSHKGVATFASNKAVSTAIWLETMLIQERLGQVDTLHLENIDNSSRYLKLMVQFIERHLENSPFKADILAELPLTKAGKSISMPFLIAQDLEIEITGTNLNKLKYLAAAGYFGWLSYKILDEVIDTGVPKEKLPLAFYCLRQQYMLLQGISGEIDFFAEAISSAWDVTDTLYRAEALQVNKPYAADPGKNRTYDMFDHIEKRMQAYLTGLAHLPYLVDTPRKLSKDMAMRELYQILKAVVLLDQLNDDARDWKDDWEVGLNTFVTQSIRAKLPKHTKKMAAAERMKSAEKTFWQETLAELTDIAIREHSAATTVINKSKCTYSNLNYLLDKSLKPINEVALTAKTFPELLEGIRNFKS